MLKDRRMLICVIVSFLVVLIWYAFQSGPAPLQTANGVNSLEQVELNGVKQWISIRGTDIHNPVLLFLHGGPGSANLAKLRLQVPELEQSFIVVNWDQPGAGKSAPLNFDYGTLSNERIFSDAHELVETLKARFGVEKIYLMGFSWGTVIGLELAAQYPEDFYAYISVSQVVSPVEAERFSLEYVQAMARDSDNEQAKTELTGIDPSYQGDDWYSQISTERKWLVRFNGVYHTAESYSHEVWMMLRAPEYSLYEFGLWSPASSHSLKQLWPEVMGLNFFESITVLDIPVFFFVGRYDQNCPAQLTERYFEQLLDPAGKHLIWFEDSAHDLFFDQPQLVVAEVLSIREKQP